MTSSYGQSSGRQQSEKALPLRNEPMRSVSNRISHGATVSMVAKGDICAPKLRSRDHADLSRELGREALVGPTCLTKHYVPRTSLYPTSSWSAFLFLFFETSSSVDPLLCPKALSSFELARDPLQCPSQTAMLSCAHLSSLLPAIQASKPSCWTSFQAVVGT